MRLITNDSVDNHETILKDLILWADKCYFCTCFFNVEGLKRILPSLTLGIADRGIKVKIFSNGKNTGLRVISKLKTIPEIEHRIVPKEKRKLHSKVYLFEKEEQFQVVIGSANLTVNGLAINEELSTLIIGVKGSAEYLEFKKYFEQLEILSKT